MRYRYRVKWLVNGEWLMSGLMTRNWAGKIAAYLMTKFDQVEVIVED